MSPIERVARAMAKDSIFYNADWKLYVSQAKAALLALSTPEAISEGMVQAYRVKWVSDSTDCRTLQGMLQSYRVAIAAALSAAAQE